MKRLILSLSILALLAATDVQAQQPQSDTNSNVGSDITALPDSVTATPDMWFYQQQMRRYDDPKSMVRQNAEFRAAQRRSRLAAMSWFGYSNLRPRVSPVPQMGSYSPTWVSNSFMRNQWVGYGQAPVVSRVERYEVERR